MNVNLKEGDEMTQRNKTQFETIDIWGFVGEQHYRSVLRARIGLDALAQLQAAELRHHDIRDHQTMAVFQEKLPGSLTILGFMQNIVTSEQTHQMFA